MAGGRLKGLCCVDYNFLHAECPIHGDSDGRFFIFASSNEQNVKPKENKASYRQHSFVEYAENPEVTYTHRPLVDSHYRATTPKETAEIMRSLKAATKMEFNGRISDIHGWLDDG